jgi:RNA-binding protein PNO1
MPAPTALRKPDQLAEAANVPLPAEGQDDELLLDAPDAEPTALDAVQDTQMQIDLESRPNFAPEKNTDRDARRESRKVMIPPHRMSPLRAAWPKIYPPLVQHLKLQVRMNANKKAVELRTSKHTTDTGALQKGEDFVKAFSLGFDVDDAVALLRLDDLYIETFEIKDVKTLQGEHLGRAIGRIAGKDGKTKWAIENASKTRVVLADSKIHILGGFKNIHIAREAIVSLILGSPPGKVYGNLRTVASRMKERF